MEVRKGFRFSQATSDNLKELVEMGVVRNETEAIDLAVEHFLTEKKTRAESRLAEESS